MPPQPGVPESDTHSGLQGLSGWLSWDCPVHLNPHTFKCYVDLKSENLSEIKIGDKNWVLNYEAAFGKVLVSLNSSPGIRKGISDSENFLICKGKLSELSPQLVIFTNILIKKLIGMKQTNCVFLPLLLYQGTETWIVVTSYAGLLG